MRDLRDPQRLGEKIRHYRDGTSPVPLSMVIDSMPLAVPDYQDGGVMSNDPAQHHSGTKQDAPVEGD